MGYKLSKERVLDVYGKKAKHYDLSHHIQTLWADDIHRKAVTKESLLNDDDLVLDVGTGTCLTAIKAIRENGNIKVVGVDISEHMLEEGKNNLKKYGLEHKVDIIRADTEKLPFRNKIYDKIISAYGMSGVQNPEEAMKELVRVSKNGARITMAEMSDVPRDYSKIWKLIHKDIIEPVIKYRWEFRDLDLRKLFEETGVKIDKTKYFRNRIIGSTTLVSGIVNK